jgi:hypothetical protein
MLHRLACAFLECVARGSISINMEITNLSLETNWIAY